MTSEERRELRKSAIKEYSKRQKESGLKLGDEIKIISKADSCSQGWIAHWTTGMSSLVGRTGRIAANGGEFGFMINVLDEDGLVVLAESGYYFPYFVLEKVE